jgi:hypothetical protein
MIDPDFWSDGRIKHLNPIERLFFLGLISHADDEGRIQANPAFLRSVIFPYDDFTLEQINSMRSHILETNPNVKLYENSGEEYLYFKKWERYQKPSHPQPSKLPKPPEEPKLQELVLEPVKETDQPKTGIIPSQVRSGQVRSGQGSVGKGSVVQADFTEITDEKDLTDRLTELLVSAAAGPSPRLREDAILKDFWQQVLGEPMNSTIHQFTFAATQDYPPQVLARAYAKAVKYKGGKTGSYKYIATILKEEMAKSRSP